MMEIYYVNSMTSIWALSLVTLLLLTWTPHTNMVSALTIAHAKPYEPEFVKSFLNRPNLLSNSTSLSHHERNSISLRSGKVTLSLYMDNWTPYILKVMKHGGLVGTYDKMVGKRAQDIDPKKRSLALRAIAGDRESDSAGVVCWVLTTVEKNFKVSRLCVGWDVGNGKKGGANVRGIAISIGDYAPSFDDIWLSKSKFEEKEKHKLYTKRILRPNTKDARFIELQKTNQLENTIYLDQPKVGIVAANLSVSNGDIHHYRLSVSVIPSNIDVWGWEKWYKPESAKIENVRRLIVGPLLKADPKQSNEIDTKPLTKNKKEKTKSLLGDPEKPLLERKKLLSEGKALAELAFNNRSLRDALLATTESVAVGIHVENWSTYRLWQPEYEMEKGRTYSEEAAKLAGTLPGPSSVDPGSQTAGIVVPDSSMSGTRGVVRWNIGGSLNRVLSVMWSVPYNRQFWRQWVAVGLSSSSDLPSYDDMYSGNNKGNNLFVRHEANGQDFEFSDDRFGIKARMEGSTYKPILHLSIAPLHNDELAPSILKFLGITPNPKLRNTARSRNPREKFSNAGAGALPSIDSASSAFSIVSHHSFLRTNSFWQPSYLLILTPTLIALMLEI